MPKAVNYHPRSIVYFEGDISQAVYVLKSGSVSLNYKDLQTGEEISERIKEGEFFGVKAALGGYTHDETAMVHLPSHVIQFSTAEFEKFLFGNQKMILKMLQVFSTQLRRTHKKVQGLLGQKTATNPEFGLLSIGDYYKKTGDLDKAREAFTKYLNYYPNGFYRKQAEAGISSLSTAYPTGGPRDIDDEGLKVLNAAEQLRECKALMVSESYNEAIMKLVSLVRGRHEGQVQAEAEFMLGIALYHNEKIDDSSRQFTSVVKRYPRHPRLGEALYYLGMCSYKKDDKSRAEGFLKKAIAMLPDSAIQKRDAIKVLKEL